MHLAKQRIPHKRLAHDLGISQQYLNNILTGYYGASKDVARKINAYFGISLDLWFISRGCIPDDILKNYSPDQIAQQFQRMREEQNV